MSHQELGDVHLLREDPRAASRVASPEPRHLANPYKLDAPAPSHFLVVLLAWAALGYVLLGLVGFYLRYYFFLFPMLCSRCSSPPPCFPIACRPAS